MKKVPRHILCSMIAILGFCFMSLAGLTFVLLGNFFTGFFYYGGAVFLLAGVIGIFFSSISIVYKTVFFIMAIVAGLIANLLPIYAPCLFGVYLDLHRTEFETASQLLSKQKGEVDLWTAWGSSPLDQLSEEEKGKVLALHRIGVHRVFKTDKKVFYELYIWIDAPTGITYFYNTHKFVYPTGF